MDSGVPVSKELVVDTTGTKIDLDGMTIGLDIYNRSIDNAVIVSFDGRIPVTKVKPDDTKYLPAITSVLYLTAETGTVELTVTSYMR